MIRLTRLLQVQAPIEATYAWEIGHSLSLQFLSVAEPDPLGPEDCQCCCISFLYSGSVSSQSRAQQNLVNVESDVSTLTKRAVSYRRSTRRPSKMPPHVAGSGAGAESSSGTRSNSSVGGWVLKRLW